MNYAEKAKKSHYLWQYKYNQCPKDIDYTYIAK